jgi:hypothetical protein
MRNYPPFEYAKQGIVPDARVVNPARERRAGGREAFPHAAVDKLGEDDEARRQLRIGNPPKMTR